MEKDCGWQQCHCGLLVSLIGGCSHSVIVVPQNWWLQTILVALFDTVFSSAISIAFFFWLAFLLIWLIQHAVQLSHMPHGRGFYSVHCKYEMVIMTYSLSFWLQMSEPITHMNTDNDMTIHHKGTSYFKCAVESK